MRRSGFLLSFLLSLLLSSARWRSSSFDVCDSPPSSSLFFFSLLLLMNFQPENASKRKSYLFREKKKKKKKIQLLQTRERERERERRETQCLASQQRRGVRSAPVRSRLALPLQDAWRSDLAPRRPPPKTSRDWEGTTRDGVVLKAASVSAALAPAARLSEEAGGRGTWECQCFRTREK